MVGSARIERRPCRSESGWKSRPDDVAGAVAYFALGHCHTPSTNIQPFVDVSVDEQGKTPLQFRGPWETKAFGRLLENGINWGLEGRSA